MAALPELNAFLARERRKPWSWASGQDCTLWVADWVMACSGRDPAAAYRGRYASADEAHELIKREGGFMPIIGYEMDRLGFARTAAPRDGDVGIVSAPVAMAERMPVVGTIAGIHQGGRWWCRGLRGLHHCDLPLVTAWRI